MVVTEGMWKSLDVYQSKQAHLWNFPLDWDPTRRKLIYYCFSKMIFLVVNIFCSWVLFLYQIFGYINLSFVPAIFLIIINMWFIFTLLVELVLLTIGQDPVAGFNELIRLDKNLNAGKTNY